MIPPLIHQIHCGGRPPVKLVGDLISISTANPLMSRIIWDEQMLAKVRIDVVKLFDRLGNWASVSNYVRLLLLKRFGGIYLDTDIQCLGPIDALREHSAFAAFQDHGRICNAVMGAESDHPWIEWQVKNFNRFDQKDAASGVYLATEAPRAGLTIISSTVCYPWMYDAQPEQKVLHSDTVMVHHWAGSWK